MEKVKNAAFKAAKNAGALLKERLGKIKNLDYKKAYDIVTDVDKASEEIVLDIIRTEFPDHEILAEESGKIASGNPNRWLIDPLDGTTNYAHSYPFFCVSIGFEVNGKVEFGVVFNPISNELFWGERSKGAYLNDLPIKVSQVARLSESLLATGFAPDTFGSPNSNMVQFKTLTEQCHGVRRDGSAALDLCFVASGRSEGFWEHKLSAWDMAAGSLIVTEAGGKVTNIMGDPLDIDKYHILATNGIIHNEILSVLNSTCSKSIA